MSIATFAVEVNKRNVQALIEMYNTADLTNIDVVLLVREFAAEYAPVAGELAARVQAIRETPLPVRSTSFMLPDRHDVFVL